MSPDEPARDVRDVTDRGFLGFVAPSVGDARWRLVDAVVVGALAMTAIARLVLDPRVRPPSVSGVDPALRYWPGPLAQGATGTVGGISVVTVVAVGVLLAALVVVARHLRLPPVAAATTLALLTVYDPALTALGSSVTGVVGTALAALTAALSTGPRRVTGYPAVVTGLAALVCAPLMVVPAAAAVAVVTRRRWAPTAAVALALGTGVVALLVVTSAPPRTGGLLPWGLTAIALVTVVAGAALAGTRPLAAAATVLLALPVVVGVTDAVVRPALVGAVVVLATLQVAALSRWAAQRAVGRRALRAVLLLGVATGVVAVAVPAALPTPTPSPSAPALSPAGPASTQELATWITTATAPSTTLAVSSALRTDLERAGVGADRFDDRGTLVVRAGTSAGGSGLARFGTGDDVLIVDATDPADTAAAVAARLPQRAAFGAQLVRNPHLVATPATQSLIRSGALDPRAMAVLAAVTTTASVTVVDLPVLAGDTAAAPRHQVVLAPLDPSTTTWLLAQQDPFRPELSAGPHETTLTWTWPSPSV